MIDMMVSKFWSKFVVVVLNIVDCRPVDIFVGNANGIYVFAAVSVAVFVNNLANNLAYMMISIRWQVMFPVDVLRLLPQVVSVVVYIEGHTSVDKLIRKLSLHMSVDIPVDIVLHIVVVVDAL